MSGLWIAFKKHTWKFVGALISDTKHNGEVAVSLGRVCFLAVLTFMFVMWSKGLGKPVETPPGLMEVFYTLAGYVFGSKALEVVGDRLKGNSARSQALENPDE